MVFITTNMKTKLFGYRTSSFKIWPQCTSLSLFFSHSSTFYSVVIITTMNYHSTLETSGHESFSLE